MCRNHVAPRTKLLVPKGDFGFPMNFTDVQRQTKISIDVLQEATIDDEWEIQIKTNRFLRLGSV